MNMYSTSEEQAGSGPLQTALEVVDDAVEQLIKTVDAGAVTDLGAFSLVDVLQSMEQIRNKLPVVDRALIQHGVEQGHPGVLSERTMIGVLKNGLRISAGEAIRRVRAAEHLAERTSMVGEPLPPIREHLAAAQRDGTVTPEQVSLIDQTLRKVSHCDPERITMGEELLVEQAGKLGYQELTVFAARLAEAIDPDGILPCDEKAQQDRRYLRLRRRGDGCWAGEFVLTGTAGQKLANLLSPLTKPQSNTVQPDNEDGTPGKKHLLEDERSPAQRKHDAFETLLDALLRGQDVPASGGTPATVLINISWEEFCREFGMGTYADGTPVSARTARDLADQAEIAWCVKAPKGAVLDLYRDRRIASYAQTLALYARDLGCSFPGCDVQPQWCERHHIVAWQDGGNTNIGNLTLVCSFHHHQFAKHGWQCRINADGLPEWIPPTWIDPQQRPILNHRITINNWHPQDTLDLDGADEPDPPDLPEPPDPLGPPGPSDPPSSSGGPRPERAPRTTEAP